MQLWQHVGRDGIRPFQFLLRLRAFLCANSFEAGFLSLVTKSCQIQNQCCLASFPQKANSSVLTVLTSSVPDEELVKFIPQGTVLVIKTPWKEKWHWHYRSPLDLHEDSCFHQVMAGPWQDPIGSPLGAMERKGTCHPNQSASSVSPTEDLGEGEAQKCIQHTVFQNTYLQQS